MKKALLVLVALLLVTGMLFVSCAQKKAPLGSEENPVVWGFVPSNESQEIVSGGEKVADMILEKTGVHVKVSLATDYAGVIEGLSSDPPSVHMASLATFAYVLAHERGVADAALVSVRYGSPTYNGQLIAGADTGITKVEDLKGKTFGRPDPLSTSGWIIPMLTMRAAGINPESDLKEIVDAGGHPAVVAAVYNGDVQAGATFVDARTSLEKQYPDVMEKVRVIAVSADIPNDGVQFSPTVPAELRDKIVNALVEIASTDEGKKALQQGYSWTDLTKKNDSFYDPFRQVLQASGMKVEDLIKE